MLKNSLTTLIAAFCMLGLTSTVASATILFSTDGTSTPAFFPSSGSTSTSGVFHAFQFTPTQNGVFDELVTAGQANASFDETFNIRVDASGTRGAIVDTASLAVVGDNVSRLYTGTSTNHVTLSAGTPYWLEASSPSGSDTFLWLEATSNFLGREYSSQTGYFDNQPLAAFALLETPPASGTPEPASWLLSLSSLAAGLALRRRSSR